MVAALGTFLGLLLLPHPHQVLGRECCPGKQVWMTAHQLVANATGHGGKIEPAALLRHVRVEHHLEQQITELVAQVLVIIALDGIGDLVRFLNRVGRDGREGLRTIPGTAVLRVAQACHELQQRGERLFGRAHGGGGSVHSR